MARDIKSILRRLPSSLRHRLSHWLLRHTALLARLPLTLTLEDAFGTPGDTLLTATICRHLRLRHPRLRINLITPNPHLLLHDPHPTTLNAPPTFPHARFWYLPLIEARDPLTNLLRPFLAQTSLPSYHYQATVHLTPQERQQALAHLPPPAPLRPLLAINTLSAEQAKNWPAPLWLQLIPALLPHHTIIHLGDHREPQIPGVHRLAGQLDHRQSMAALSHATRFIGPVSFLMHAANGLRIPSVIIYGGRETPANSGYPQNANLHTPIPCGPCWLHSTRGDLCPHSLACMAPITPALVLHALQTLPPFADSPPSPLRPTS